VCVPIFHLRQCLVNAVVEVFVVREDNVAANIIELTTELAFVLEHRNGTLTKPSGVTSVDASPPGVSLESIIIHDGPF
jgi:hypothetical protein